tara:strand:- start:1339 stop:1581 length:243 start_codon:yes stop_codon:yes gene_type:complete
MIKINKLIEGNWITLKGITGHGKNRIREHGDKWLVEKKCDNKLMLRSRHETFKAGGVMHFDGRWVDIPTDKNFEITEINC